MRSAAIDMPDNHGATAGNTFSNNFISMAAGTDGTHVVGGARISSADLPHWKIEANVWAVDGNATLGMACECCNGACSACPASF